MTNANDVDAAELDRQRQDPRDATIAQQAERLAELELALYRVSELAHDLDGDSFEKRSARLGECSLVAFACSQRGQSWVRAHRQIVDATIARLTAERDELSAKASDLELQRNDYIEQNARLRVALVKAKALADRARHHWPWAIVDIERDEWDTEREDLDK
jgi:hypothetical protein